ncbi:GTPase [Kribbia dieselivorans]|uniref:GTPase n=1 Tax=Kribbia dieselivorans TaxID=331526 RepID=UPI0009FB47E6|nr:GTPase [Kribbia dieselivorans]
MTPVFNTTRRRSAEAAPQISADTLADRLQSLESALISGGSQLDPVKVDAAEQVTAKVHERIRLTGGRTVVALAGATGSGKSSLFNALVGEDVSRVGVLRPTTSKATAAIFGDEPAGDLLDWLKVGARHTVSGDDTSLDGLVLLDLPDVDSFETAHRDETERLLALVDVFVWVTDPQKYADARLHDDFVAALADYDTLMLVVLNQSDRLTPPQVQQCLDDLRQILVRDGITAPHVFATSATTGDGLPQLRAELEQAVSGSTAARVRLATDLTTNARALRSDVADSETDPTTLATPGLVDALSRAAGVPTVLDAVGRDFRQESLARTGWPFTRWVQALRPDPLKRLRVNGSGRSGKITEADVRQVLGRSSIPPPTPAARAAVDLATAGMADRAATGLPVRWGEAVTDAASPGDDNLADALDQAVIAAPLRGRAPLWWSILGALQVLFALTAIVGFVWLAVLGVAAWLQVDIPTPQTGPFGTPFVLLAGGLLLGGLLALLAKPLASAGARRRTAQVAADLRERISGVAQNELVAPVADVLARHRETREHLQAAAGQPSRPVVHRSA